MSTLYLIRHGQASFGAADYDVLSELGAEQSRVLGGHLARRGMALDAVYTGPRRRQIDTGTALLEAARAAGGDYPDAEVLEGLDEYPAFELIKYWTPRLQKGDPSFQAILADVATAPKKQLQRAFELIVGKWATGELVCDELETFERFVGRVEDALGHIMRAQGRGKRVAVVTSGGPISIAMKLALGIADARALRIAWVIANTSLSEFRYRDERELTLVAFNRIPHFTDDRLVTYR